MNNAVCLGGTKINVNSGYWRENTNSSLVYKCLREEVCQGGYVESNIHPVKCKTGYKGIL